MSVALALRDRCLPEPWEPVQPNTDYWKSYSRTVGEYDSTVIAASVSPKHIKKVGEYDSMS